jgi:cell division protease FtsH
VATDVAFKMVAHYGMSESIGPVFHEQRVEHPLLGQRLATDTGVSDATAHAIDAEVQRVLTGALVASRETLTENVAAHERLVAALLESETLERPDLERVLGPSAHDASGARRRPHDLAVA